jgi:hypothetical protein
MCFSADLWTELYSESIAETQYQDLIDTYYGTFSFGISFKKFDLYATTLRYGADSNGFFYTGPGVRSAFDIRGVSVNPFGEVLFANSGTSLRFGLFSTYRFKMGE